MIFFLYLLAVYYQQNFILTEHLYYRSFSNKLTEEQIQRMFKSSTKWDILAYLIIPIPIILRATYTWFCLRVGSFIKEKFSASNFWNICIQGELIFALGVVSILLYSEFFSNIKTIDQLTIHPFSVQAFVVRTIPAWSNYFFYTLNLFELLYILFIAYLLAKESKINFFDCLKFVTISYLPGLLIWILFVSYLSVIFQS